MIRLIQLISDALSERIKNPWLGSIFLVFIGINWQPLMYLSFANEDLTIRFDYFDENSTLGTLLWIPICVGFLLSVATLIISAFYQWIINRPNQWNQSQFQRNQSQFWKNKESNIYAKINFEEIAQKLVRLRSKTEEITKSINDPDTQKEIKQTLSEVRNGATSTSELPPNLNAFFKDNNLLEKTTYEIMKGTTQYLTRYKETFTKGDLYAAVVSHNNWAKNRKNNQSKYWKKLIDSGKIIQKTPGNYYYQG